MRWLCMIAAMLLCSCGTSDDESVNGSTDPSCGVWTAEQNTIESQVLVEMNAQRAEGVDCASGPKEPAPAVQMHETLQDAARCHSQDMVTNNFFDHAGSNGSRFNERIADAGYPGQARYENIAVGQRDAASVVASWMGSQSGHCDAIMDPDITHIGIGYAPGGEMTDWPTYWTATFGRE